MRSSRPKALPVTAGARGLRVAVVEPTGASYRRADGVNVVAIGSLRPSTRSALRGGHRHPSTGRSSFDDVRVALSGGRDGGSRTRQRNRV